MIRPCMADVALRPMTPADRDLVFRWRNRPGIRNNMRSADPITPAEHEVWFARLTSETGSHLMMFEYKGAPTGVSHIRLWPWDSGTGIWGFYIGRDDAPPGLGAVMGYLTLEHAFGALGPDEVAADVLSTNGRSLGMLAKLAFRPRERPSTQIAHNGVQRRVVRMTIDRVCWATVRLAIRSRLFADGDMH